MRNMSFMLTTEQIRNQTKTVTRRLGWSFLKPGDTVMACVKCMGLKKGEKIEKICPIKIKSIRREWVEWISKEECVKEGFPDMETYEFIDMFCHHMKCAPFDFVNRIEFEYIQEQNQ